MNLLDDLDHPSLSPRPKTASPWKTVEAALVLRDLDKRRVRAELAAIRDIPDEMNKIFAVAPRPLPKPRPRRPRRPARWKVNLYHGLLNNPLVFHKNARRPRIHGRLRSFWLTPRPARLIPSWLWTHHKAAVARGEACRVWPELILFRRRGSFEPVVVLDRRKQEREADMVRRIVADARGTLWTADPIGPALGC